MLEQLLNTGNCISGLSNAASLTVAKHVLTFGSTDEAASFIFVYLQSSADYRSSLARPPLIG
jgi:hypothetical protein